MEFFWQCLISLVAVVDPLAAAAIFAATTDRNTYNERRRMARRAAAFASGILFFFLFAGQALLAWFSVSLDAFRIAGGIILAVMSMDLLKATDTGVRTTPAELDEGISKPDVSLTPIAVPLLAGPGAISTVMVLAATQPAPKGVATVTIVIVLVGLLSWAILHFSTSITRRLGATGMNVISRLIGLLLLAVAVQFVLDGLNGFFFAGHPSPSV
ncbi:MAG TPA: MarC family protein [Mariprofundaceae bacterium]|nr:MarC family protein [Mariprofundaceae bacterium]